MSNKPAPIQSVQSIDAKGTTPEDQLAELERLMEVQKANDKLISEIRAGLEKVNASKVAQIRANIVRVDREMAKLAEERKALASEHFKLTGLRYRAESE